jgi:MSHA pilin protein MshC
LAFPTSVQNAYSADGFANVLLQDLNYTKVLSMSGNQRYKLVISGSSYQIQNEVGTPQLNYETGGTTVPFTDGVTVTPTGTIDFDSLGRPYQSGSPIGSAVVFTVSASGESTTVSVTPQTGLVQ